MLMKVTFSPFQESFAPSLCPAIASQGHLHQRRSLSRGLPPFPRDASPGRFAGSGVLPRMEKKIQPPQGGFLILPNTSRQQMHQQEAALSCK